MCLHKYGPTQHVQKIMWNAFLSHQFLKNWPEKRNNLFKAFIDLPINSLLFKNSGESLSECWGPPRLCLDSDLDGLHRTQGNVGEELSRGTGCQIQGCPPQESIFLEEVLKQMRNKCNKILLLSNPMIKISVLDLDWFENINLSKKI